MKVSHTTNKIVVDCITLPAMVFSLKLWKSRNPLFFIFVSRILLQFCYSRFSNLERGSVIYRLNKNTLNWNRSSIIIMSFDIIFLQIFLFPINKLFHQLWFGFLCIDFLIFLHLLIFFFEDFKILKPNLLAHNSKISIYQGKSCVCSNFTIVAFFLVWVESLVMTLM